MADVRTNPDRIRDRATSTRVSIVLSACTRRACRGRDRPVMTETTEDRRPAAHCACVPQRSATACSDLDLTGEAISVAGTLLESSRLVADLLKYLSPELCRRTERITRLVMQTVGELGLDGRWEFEAAARLSQIGYLALGRDTLDALTRGQTLSDDADRALASHPLVARDLLAGVRRLDAVREMIARQREPFTVAGLPPGVCTGHDRVTLGGQLLRVATDAEALLSRGVGVDDVVRLLQAEPDEYNQELVQALAACITTSC